MDIISTSDLMKPGWNFLEKHCDDDALVWRAHSGSARNAIERAFRHPFVPRFRAAFEGALDARRTAKSGRKALLVSHLPKMSAATQRVRRTICPETRHIAFSFNFTALPTGVRHRSISRSLRGIDEFVVFSQMERKLYSEYFGIDPERLVFLPWAMDAPTPGSENPMAGAGAYVCAIGGEARDYRVLADAMRDLPNLNLAIVARSYSIAGIDFPENVSVFVNLSHDTCWALASGSIGMVVPLISSQTACGHVTIVGAQKLGIPLVTTRSSGTIDYVDETTAALVEAKDVLGLRQAIESLVEERETFHVRAEAAQEKAARENDLNIWVDYFQNLKRRLS